MDEYQESWAQYNAEESNHYGDQNPTYQEERPSYFDSGHTFVNLGQRLTFYDDLLRSHKESWKQMNKSAPEANLARLDSQLRDLVDHPLSVSTPCPYGGSGEPRPEVVFVLKAPGYREVQYGENRDIALTNNGDCIKTWMDQIMPSVPCYYMYLYPFYLSKLTTEYQDEEKDRPSGSDNAGFNRPRLDLNDTEKARLYDYARQRLRLLKPRAVVCFGNEVFSALASGLDHKQSISSFKLKDVAQKTRDVIVTSAVDGDTKFAIIHCPHPYTYSEAVRKSNEQSYCTETAEPEAPSVTQNQVVLQWESAFIHLSKVLTRGETIVGAYDVLMNMEKVSEDRITIQAALSGEVKVASKTEEKKKKPAPKKAAPPVRLQKGQCVLGQGKILLDRNVKPDEIAMKFTEVLSREKNRESQKVIISEVPQKTNETSGLKRKRADAISAWLSGKETLSETVQEAPIAQKAAKPAKKRPANKKAKNPKKTAPKKKPAVVKCTVIFPNGRKNTSA